MQRVLKTPDPFLDAEKIRAATFVRHVEIHDTLGSTNVRALELARNAQIDLPALVVARLQTAGKGRGRNTWWATDGALTFTLLLDAQTLGMTPTAWPQLSLAAAVAVCDALATYLRRSTPPLQIKWPNDVLLDGRKICGILIESPGGAAPAKNRLILGVGINVNNSWVNAPNELRSSGTALRDVTNNEHDLQAVLVGVLNAIVERAEQLRQQDERLVHVWQRLNFLAARRIVVETDRGEIQGDCEGIAEDGALVLNTPTGQQRLYSGSVRPV